MSGNQSIFEGVIMVRGKGIGYVAVPDYDEDILIPTEALNFLITEKIIEGKKINVLSRKSPIVDEAKIKAEADAKAAKEKAEADAKTAKEKAEADAKLAEEEAKKVAEETPVVEEAIETPAEDVAPVEEAPIAEEAKVA